MNKFATGDTLYVVEREPDDTPLCVGRYTFLTKLTDSACIVKHIQNTEVYDTNGKVLIEDLLLDSSLEEDLDLWVFPISDCYTSYEKASQAIGIYHMMEVDNS